jgi:hypothetical protein
MYSPINDSHPPWTNPRGPATCWIAVASPHVLIATPRWVRLNRAAVDHRRFWDAMDRLGEGQLREIETRLSRRMVTEFELDPTGLALDMTKLRHLHRHPSEASPGHSRCC